ncbi:isochorismatase family protein [Streptomyces fulvissimus]|uniref:Isochorismatase family protein n=1 Tax=Streptomyces microflavus TaxID=1919 RepID=A0A6N9V2P4_STRMI|nr:isochorismatase family protein [Streptomyces microflavus]NEB67110.1 isochorismatase family protein [Streptomyces microflavus]NEE44720.1 isochorismatase family protein [Streptomyces sp. SID8455]
MPGIPPIPSYSLPTAGDLPANVAPWTVDPDRAALLVHDMQHYFLRPLAGAGPLREELVANIAALRERCEELDVPVGYTAQPGGMSSAQRGLLKDFWGEGMRMDPADREVVAPLTPRAHNWQFTKWRYSAFFRSDLLGRMREQGRDQLILCGVYAHVGILATAVDAFTNDIETFVVADGVADFSAGHHRSALSYAAQRCAVVDTAGRLLGGLARPGKRVPRRAAAGAERRSAAL